MSLKCEFGLPEIASWNGLFVHILRTIINKGFPTYGYSVQY